MLAQGGNQDVDHARGVRGGRRRPDPLRQRADPNVEPRDNGQPTNAGRLGGLANQVLPSLLGVGCRAVAAAAGALTADLDREIPGAVLGIVGELRAAVTARKAQVGELGEDPEQTLIRQIALEVAVTCATARDEIFQRVRVVRERISLAGASPGASSRPRRRL